MGCAWFCPFSFGGISQYSGTVLVPGPLCMPFSCSLFSRENKTSTCTYKHRHLIMCLKCPSNSLMEVCRINTVFPYSSPRRPNQSQSKGFSTFILLRGLHFPAVFKLFSCNNYHVHRQRSQCQDRTQRQTVQKTKMVASFSLN